MFATFTDAYLAVLAQVTGSSQHEIATRGNTAREILNVCFTVDDPLTRSPYLAARKANIVFNHAEALWYLSGHDDLAMIAHYAPRLRAFSADGQRLTGTAYGPRLFGRGSDGASQFDRVIALLRADPDTKRAAMVIMQPGELADPANPDVACTLALHFMLRGGALHLAAHMRANDAVTGLLCDVFSFTFIQEYAARLLGAPPRSPTPPGDEVRGVDWSQWTVILLKPDCLARNLTGPVLAMAGEYVCVTAERVVYPTEEQVFTHYADILPLSTELGVDVPAELRRIYLGHPVMVALGHGPNAAARLRAVLGPTDPADAGPDTIRGRFGTDTLRKARSEGRLIDNLIHTSDHVGVVARDLAVWFGSGATALLTPVPPDPGGSDQ